MSNTYYVKSSLLYKIDSSGNIDFWCRKLRCWISSVYTVSELQSMSVQSISYEQAQALMEK